MPYRTPISLFLHKFLQYVLQRLVCDLDIAIFTTLQTLVANCGSEMRWSSRVETKVWVVFFYAPRLTSPGYFLHLVVSWRSLISRLRVVNISPI